MITEDDVTVRRNLKAAAFLSLCVIATGCGARVDSTVRQQVAAASLGQGGTGTGTGTGTTDGGTTVDGGTPLPGQTAGPGGAPLPGQTAGPGAAPLPGATSGTGSQAPSGPVNNGGATDVGVTPTAITIGNVSDLSGPVPGLFQAAPYGVRAYVNYINSVGGVNGRQLRLVTADGQTDCTANKNAHTNLKNKVFAFVGSFSLYDNCGNDVLEADKNLPDVSYPLALGKKNSKASTFSPAPTPPGYPNGMFQYYAQKFPNEVKKVGVIFPDVPAAAYNSRSIENAAKSAGWVYISRNSHAATASTFNDQVAAMKAAGVQLVCTSRRRTRPTRRRSSARPTRSTSTRSSSSAGVRVGLPRAARRQQARRGHHGLQPLRDVLHEVRPGRDPRGQAVRGVVRQAPRPARRLRSTPSTAGRPRSCSSRHFARQARRPRAAR